MNNSSRRRLLRNYLLNRKIQLQYTVIMVLVSSLLTTGLGYFWYDQVRVTSRTIEVNALGSIGEEGARQIQNELAKQDRNRLFVLIGFGVLLAIVMAWYGIVLTHKIAGPLYKISRYVEHLRDGKLGVTCELRKGDKLQDFFETFKELQETLQTQTKNELVTIQAAISALEKFETDQRVVGAPDLTIALDNLKSLRKNKEESLQEEI